MAMRELILKRIEELRVNTGGFPETLQRWKGFTHGQIPLNQIKFDTLNDDNLLFLFERILKRYHQQ